MASITHEPHKDPQDVLRDIHASLTSLRRDFQRLSTSVEAVEQRVEVLSGLRQLQESPLRPVLPVEVRSPKLSEVFSSQNGFNSASPSRPGSSGSNRSNGVERKSSLSRASNSISSKINLTTYPGQSGIDPIRLIWGHVDPIQRGPVVVSRGKSTIRRRNAVGAHGGSYSIYFALAVASKSLDADHKPDFTNTYPAVNIGPFQQWADPTKIVSMDPLGHLAPQIYSDLMQRESIDIKPTIAITKAHMRLPELEHSVQTGRLVPDGKICLNEKGEIAVTKFAIEPVWYLPGIAERFDIGKFPTP